jgi:hypothetical protein
MPKLDFRLLTLNCTLDNGSLLVEALLFPE